GLASGGSGSGLSVPGGVWSIVLDAREESMLPASCASARPTPVSKIIKKEMSHGGHPDFTTNLALPIGIVRISALCQTQARCSASMRYIAPPARWVPIAHRSKVCLQSWHHFRQQSVASIWDR